MQLAIYNRVYKPNESDLFKELFCLLEQYDIQYTIYRPLYESIKDVVVFKTDPELFDCHLSLSSDTDIFLSIGGDGTLLGAVSIVRDKDIPILGINLGRLGFLADVPKNDIEFALQCLLNRNYQLETRNLLKLDSNKDIFADFPYALNDFTILKKDSSSMIKIHTYLNGQFMNTYWSDGLIIATPTGSTGYSLSCNGPVVFPQTNAFIITPVSPHNLNIRPMVVPNDFVLSFEVEGRAAQFLTTMDSRQEAITKDVQLAIRKADFSAVLVKIAANNFIDTLREKLNWGIDERN